MPIYRFFVLNNVYLLVKKDISSTLTSTVLETWLFIPEISVPSVCQALIMSNMSCNFDAGNFYCKL